MISTLEPLTWYQLTLNFGDREREGDVPFLICSPSSNCFCNAAGSVVLEFSVSQSDSQDANGGQSCERVHTLKCPP